MLLLLFVSLGKRAEWSDARRSEAEGGASFVYVQVPQRVERFERVRSGKLGQLIGVEKTVALFNRLVLRDTRRASIWRRVGGDYSQHLQARERLERIARNALN